MMREFFVRLNKYIALCGAASRRGADHLIGDGRISVNGVVVKTLGTIIDPDMDTVALDGVLLKADEEKVYIMLNKPAGYISSCKDEKGRKTVLELIRDIDARVYPVGRLDFDTEGLLILTNDGNFAYHCTHPKHEIDKKYFAIVYGTLDANTIKQLREGVVIDGIMTSRSKIDVVRQKNNDSEIFITIHEGRNRQIKKMFEKVGCSVSYLKRVSIGSLELNGLPTGQWRKLTEDDIKQLGV